MNKFILTPIFIILFLGALLFLLMPKLSELSALKQEVSLKEEEFALKQNNFNFVLNSLREAEYYKEIINNLKAAIPSDFFSADLLGFFQEKAEASGLIFQGISEGQNETESTGVGVEASVAEPGQALPAVVVNSKIKEFNFSLQVQGSIENFEAFLKQLELSSRLVEVSSFSFQPVSSFEGEAGEMPEFDVEAKVYHY
ncbi:hypothetical protein L6252_00060 [Candidatus Parcubacteria bacterium]|nr:hypothetical protein [Candidatus Parcubacteria bacterium]